MRVESLSSREVGRPSDAGPTLDSGIAGGVIVEAFPRPALDHQSNFASREGMRDESGSSLAEVPSHDPGAAALVIAAAGGAATKPASLSQEISASGPGP